MKHIIITICILLGVLSSFSQETIDLDGVKMFKKDLIPNIENKVDVQNTDELKDLLKSASKENKKIHKQAVYVAKERKAYAQVTILKTLEDVDKKKRTSTLKFIDEKGKLKWKKEFEGKAPWVCFISEDGKNITTQMIHYSNDPFSEYITIEVWDENGTEKFKTELPATRIDMSASCDIVMYQNNAILTGKESDNKEVFFYDLKSNISWSRKYDYVAEPCPACANGDWVLVYYNGMYDCYSRKGEKMFTRSSREFGRGIADITENGKYALSRDSGDKLGYFEVYDLSTMDSIRIYYHNVAGEDETKKHLFYNGGAFIGNTNNLIAMSSVVANYTGMITIFDIKGNYLGHIIFDSIATHFLRPRITLLETGELNVYVDGKYWGVHSLPDSDLTKYLKN